MPTNKNDSVNPQKFTLELKPPVQQTFEQDVEPTPEPLQRSPLIENTSTYHKFRHFMYTHLQNKWVKTVLVAAVFAGVIIALEVIIKIFRGH